MRRLKLLRSIKLIDKFGEFYEIYIVYSSAINKKKKFLIRFSTY